MTRGRKPGNKLVRVRDDLVQVIDELLLTRKVKGLYEMEKGAGLITREGDTGGWLSRLMSRLRENGHANADAEAVAKMEAWTGVRLRHENPEPYELPRHRMRAAREKSGLWFEVTVEPYRKVTAIDLVWHNPNGTDDMLRCLEMDGTADHTRENAMATARLWAHRVRQRGKTCIAEKLCLDAAPKIVHRVP